MSAANSLIPTLRKSFEDRGKPNANLKDTKPSGLPPPKAPTKGTEVVDSKLKTRPQWRTAPGPLAPVGKGAQGVGPGIGRGKPQLKPVGKQIASKPPAKAKPPPPGKSKIPSKSKPKTPTKRPGGNTGLRPPVIAAQPARRPLSTADRNVVADLQRIQDWVVLVRRSSNFKTFAPIVEQVKQTIFTPAHVKKSPQKPRPVQPDTSAALKFEDTKQTKATQGEEESYDDFGEGEDFDQKISEVIAQTKNAEVILEDGQDYRIGGTPAGVVFEGGKWVKEEISESPDFDQNPEKGPDSDKNDELKEDPSAEVTDNEQNEDFPVDLDDLSDFDEVKTTPPVGVRDLEGNHKLVVESPRGKPIEIEGSKFRSGRFVRPSSTPATMPSGTEGIGDFPSKENTELKPNVVIPASPVSSNGFEGGSSESDQEHFLKPKHSSSPSSTSTSQSSTPLPSPLKYASSTSVSSTPSKNSSIASSPSHGPSATPPKSGAFVLTDSTTLESGFPEDIDELDDIEHEPNVDGGAGPSSRPLDEFNISPALRKSMLDSEVRHKKEIHLDEALVSWMSLSAQSNTHLISPKLQLVWLLQQAQRVA